MGDNPMGIQLAKTVPMSSITYPCRAELKLDDVRLIITDGKFYSRKGKRTYLPETEAKLEHVKDYFVDVACIVNHGKVVDRKVVAGLLATARANKPIDETRLRFGIIDVLTSTERHERKTRVSLLSRRSRNEVFVQVEGVDMFSIPSVTIHNLRKLQEYYELVRSQGFEGLVVKHDEDLYQFKRSDQWARFKGVGINADTADLMCVGTTKGEGKYTGMIGALVFEGVVEGKKVYVKAGSGLTDKDRAKEPSFFVGKVHELKYTSIISNKTTGRYSLFQPIYSHVRDDK